MHLGNGENRFLTKLHFQLRLKARDFSGVGQLHAEAERITDIVQGSVDSTRVNEYMTVCMTGPHFGGSLVDALQTVSKKFDGDRIVRFGWMSRSDIAVMSAVVSRI